MDEAGGEKVTRLLASAQRDPKRRRVRNPAGHVALADREMLDRIAPHEASPHARHDAGCFGVVDAARYAKPRVRGQGGVTKHGQKYEGRQESHYAGIG